MENFIIRNVDPEKDAEPIAGIYSYYVESTTVTFETAPLDVEKMRERIEGIAKKCPYFVAENGGEIIGYCYVHPWKERQAYYPTYETTVYITPCFKGKGIGRRLMELLIADCKGRGYHSLIACITAENEESRRFHERLGFLQASLFKEVGEKFGRLLDVVDYQLLLR